MANEVGIKVSDKFISRGGYSAARKGLKDVEDDAKRVDKTLSGLGDGMGKAGEKGSFSFIGSLKGMASSALDIGGNISSSLVESMAGGIGKGSPHMQAAMAASLLTVAGAVGPLVGGALAGGVVAGFGAGIVGIGIAAAAQNQAVKNEFAELWRDVKGGAREAAAPLEGVLIRFAGQAKTTFNSFRDDLGRAFKDISPQVDNFGGSLLRAIGKLEPAIQPLSRAFGKVLDDLGPTFERVMAGISDALMDVAESVEQSPEALGDLIELMGDFVEMGLDVIGMLNTWWEGNKRLFDLVTTPLEWVGLKDAQEEAPKAAEAIDEVSEAQKAAADAAQQHESELARLNQQLSEHLSLIEESINADLSLREAQFQAGQSAEQVADAQKALNDAIRTYGKDSAEAKTAQNELTQAQFDGERSALQVAEAAREAAAASSVAATEEGRAAEGARAYALALFDLAAAGNGSAVPALQSILNRMSSTELQTLGLTRSTNGLGQAVYSLPNGKTITIQANASTAQWVIDRFVTDNAGRVIPMTISVTQIPSGRSPYARAHGGVVGAAGTGTYQPMLTAATGGVRGTNTLMNEQGPEAVRLPQGSTVVTAGFTREMERRWSQGMSGSGNITLEYVGGGDDAADRVLFEVMRTKIRVKGGNVQKVLGS